MHTLLTLSPPIPSRLHTYFWHSGALALSLRAAAVWNSWRWRG